MDFTNVTALIGSFGFPIVACIVMGWYVKYQMDESNKRLDRITEEHKQEVSEVTKALNNNTIALEKLCERIGD